MYKCLECGHIFEDGEEARWTEPHGEKMNGCPICKSAYAISQKCNICKSEFIETELYGGVCLECVKHSITPESTAQYVSDMNLDANFFVSFFFDSDVEKASNALIDVCKADFFSQAIRKKYAVIKRCAEYLMDDEEHIEDYAKWRYPVGGEAKGA